LGALFSGVVDIISSVVDSEKILISSFLSYYRNPADEQTDRLHVGPKTKGSPYK